MLNATLISRTDITEGLVISQVRPDAPIPDFKPGQYIALGLPAACPRPDDFPAERSPQNGDGVIKRAYSIGSTPDQRNHLEFCIAIVPEGSLTPRLDLLQPGERLFAASKITGNFTLEGTPEDANLIMVATGTGIAPFMSMLRTASTWTPGRKISLLHGVRFPADLVYREELEALSRNHPAFTYNPVVSRANNEWTGCRGHVQGQFASGNINLDPNHDHVFLCGNPRMIDETEDLLTKNGYQIHSRNHPGNLHLERYWTEKKEVTTPPLPNLSTLQQQIS